MMRYARGLALASVGLLLPAIAWGASLDNNVEWDGVYSDNTANFISPFPFKTGDTVTLKVRTPANDLTGAVCRVWLSGVQQEKRIAMTKLTAPTGSRFDLWGATLTVPTGTTQLWYRFELTDGSTTDYYDAGTSTDNWQYRGMSSDFRGDGSNFVAVPGFSTPAWTQGRVFYHIFPDRFFDGSSSNNVQLPDDCIGYLDYGPALAGDPRCEGFINCGKEGKNCEIHDTWNESPNGGPCDYFGGDLQGVTAKLSYISELSAQSVYLNPIFRSLSNHKYDIMDYDEVDPRFGGNAALSQLQTSAQAMGLRVVIDGVFNHVADVGKYYNLWAGYSYGNGMADGTDYYPATCGAWEETFLNSKDSTWADCSSSWSDWFKSWVGTDTWDVDCDGDKAESSAHVCGWYGFEFMPEIDYKAPGQADSEPRVWLYGGSGAGSSAAVKSSVAGKWLSDGSMLSKGLDGWRLDVPDNAGYFTSSTASDCSKTTNDMSIWQGFRKTVKAAGADKYVVGEIWNSAESWALADTYDGVMNYHYFGMPVSCYVTGQGVHSDASECSGAYAGMKDGTAGSTTALDAHLAAQRKLYPAPFLFSSMNMLSSHDTSRFYSRAGQDVKKLEQATFMQATLPGAPTIYYGDEVAVAGNNNEQGRATFPWSVLDDKTSSGSKMRELTRKLMCVHNSFTALQTGSFVTLSINDTEETYGFGRFTATDTAVVAINNDGAQHNVTLPVSRVDVADGVVMTDLLADGKYTVSGGKITVPVAAHGGVILVPADKVALADHCFAPPQSPTADAGPDQTIMEGDILVLDGSGSFDPAGRTLSYSWFQGDASGTPVGNSMETEVSGLAAGEYMYTLVVNNLQPYNNLSSDFMMVTVVPDNLPPVAQISNPDIQAEVGNTVVIDGSKSYDPDGDVITYTWLDPTGVVLGTESSLRLENVQAGVYNYQLVVSDGELEGTAWARVDVSSGPSCPQSPSAKFHLGFLLPMGLGGLFMAMRRRTGRK